MLAKQTYKVCRRLGAGVFDKCQTQKFVLSEARHAKSQKRGGRRTVSDFAKQLLEKQRIRFAYGFSERQLRRYVEEANRVSALGVDPITRMIEEIEMRLDNVVYRSGMARSRRAARQLVSHGHVLVNGVRSTIPSMKLKEGDIFALRTRTRGLPVADHIKTTLADAKQPTWIAFDTQALSGTVTARPTQGGTEMVGSVGSILEYYSR